MLVSNIIIKLIINLITWYYYFCSTEDCISEDRKFIRGAVWWTWEKIHTRNICTKI